MSVIRSHLRQADYIIQNIHYLIMFKQAMCIPKRKRGFVSWALLVKEKKEYTLLKEFT